MPTQERDREEVPTNPKGRGALYALPQMGDMADSAWLVPEKAKAACGDRFGTWPWKVSADQRADQSKGSLWAGDELMIEMLDQGCPNIDPASVGTSA